MLEPPRTSTARIARFACLYREGGPVDPLAGKRRHGPGSQAAPGAGGGHQAELAARVALVGPGAEGGIGQRYGGGHYLMAGSTRR
jgi:hypothetical protein